MGDGATTSTVELLERSAELDALDGHLAAVARAGPRTARADRRRGRDRQDGARAGVLRARAPRPGPVGRVRRALHAAPARPASWTSPTRWAASSARRWPRAPPPARSSRRSRAIAARRGRRTSSCSRTCTGPTRRRSTSCACSPAASSRSRRSCSPPIATTSSTARHPLRIVLGELPSGSAARLALAPLSARGGGRARRLRSASTPPSCTARTAGNPFFVTEVLAAADAEIPDDRPRRRARPRRAARRAARARCWTPSRSCRCAPSCGCSRRWPTASSTASTRCLASGMLRAERDAVGFRHEIARVAVEEALAPAPAPGAAPPGARGARRGAARPDPARLAHHAEAADDAEAVLRYAPAAGERAAMLGSHREAAAQFARALRYGAGLAVRSPRRAARAPLVRVLPDRTASPSAIEARRRALDEHRAAGDTPPPGRRAPLAVAAGLVRGRQRDGRGRGAAGGRAARAARARAASSRWPTATWRSCGCSPATSRGATHWGERAIELAERLGETEIVVHALNNMGTAELSDGIAGRAWPSSSAASSWRSRPASRSTSRARTRTWAPARCRCARLRARRRHLDAGIAYCAEHDLDVVARLHDRLAGALRARPGALGRRGRDRDARCSRARTSAAPSAHHAARRSSAACARAAATPTRGRRSTRRSRSRARTARCSASAPVAARPRRGALARRRGRGDRRPRPTRRSRSRSSTRDRWAAGELCVWRRRAGIVDDARRRRRRRAVPRSSSRATARRPPQRWTRAGLPVRGGARAGATPTTTPRSGAALAELQRLGARPAARRVARALRERGVRDVRRGPAGRDAREPGRADGARARGARARGRGAAQRRDRRAAVRVREDGRPPRLGRSCASSASPRAARPAPRPRASGIVER